MESDKALIDRLRKEDQESFHLLYIQYFPVVSSYVRKNMGNQEDAQDLFQETMVVLLNKVRQPEFELTSSLKTYLFSIARNLWLKRLRDNKKISIADFETYQQQTDLLDFDLTMEKTSEEKLSDWLTKITQHCQQILKAIFFFNEPMENLMKKMGWKNKHTAANQQYKCIQQVKKVKEKEA